MRRVKHGVALGAVLALGFGLTACGGSGDSGSSGGSGEGGSLLIWADEKRAKAIQDLAKSWGDENGVNVTVTQINFEDLKDQYAQQAPAGQGPDILIGASDWVGDFQASGLIAPIDLGDNKSKFNEAAVNVFSVNGQTFGLPVATENIIMFRNKTLAPEAPKSINAMAETGLKLQSEGKTDFPIGVPVGDKGDAYHSYPFFSAAGGYFFGGPDADGAYDFADVGLASEGGLTFAKAWSEFGKQGVVKSTFSGDDLKNAWAAGKLAYWMTGPWNSDAVKESGIDYSVEPLPGWDGVEGKAVPIVGGQGFMLNQNSNNKTTAQAFLDATMNTDFMNSLFEADPRPPAWNESAQAASADPIISAILEFGQGGFPNLPNPAMGVIYEEAGLAQKKILDGADPEATIKEAQANTIARIGSGS